MLTRIYRLEHRDSRLGPFHHERQNYPNAGEVIMRGLRCGRGVMEDIDELPQVRALLCEPDVKFGYSDEIAMWAAIGLYGALVAAGFEVVEFDAEVLYHHPADNQVLFRDTRPLPR